MDTAVEIGPALHLAHLMGCVCKECHAPFMPAVARCPHCGSKSLEPRQFTGAGTLLSYSELFVTGKPFGRGPLFIGFVKLDAGPSLLAQLTDVNPDDLRTGARVRCVVRKLRPNRTGLIEYGVKFQLEPAAPAPERRP